MEGESVNINVYNEGNQEGQKMMAYRGKKSRKNQCPVSWLMCTPLVSEDLYCE